MKNKTIRTLSIFTIAVALVIAACKKKFLEQQTVGLLTEVEAGNLKGANQFLIGTYAALKGLGWEGGISNWVYGSIVGGEANKGSDAGDQNAIVPIQQYSPSPTNGYFDTKWRALYEGIARANGTIRILNKLTTADISDIDKNQLLAEARFLRGYYHFEAKKMWNKIPYVDETIGVAEAKVGNTEDVWPKIMADLDFARNTLVEKPSAVGRINKWGAIAMAAKAQLYQGKYAEARTLFTDVITNGKNSRGEKYDLAPAFHDNFNASRENAAEVRAESVFAFEASVNDGSGGNNANFDQVLNFPYNGGPGGCCGFFQPTFDFVNSFRTNATGLPLLDRSYNLPANEVRNDMGLKSDDPSYTPDQGNLDPRLDWTVGRRGIPYLDWGPHPGANWIRDQNFGGPFAPKKMTYYKSQEKTLTDATNWASGLTATNYKIMRFADVLLMGAEAEIEGGSLEKAREYINRVRARAATPSSFVPGANANYVIGLYNTPFASQAEARAAVRFERKLELGMEGHRFFDLVRWGIADQEINAILAHEKTKIPSSYGAATFVKGRNEYFPLPQRQIDLQTSGGQSNLTQNPGYQ
jgi:hypothetical protein